MDLTDHDTDHPQDMAAMVLSGDVATVLSVSAATPSSKMITVPSPRQMCLKDICPCDSYERMDHLATVTCVGHVGSQSCPTSQNGGLDNTDMSAPSLETVQPAGHVLTPHGVTHDTDMCSPKCELDQTNIADIPSKVEVKTDIRAPALELDHKPLSHLSSDVVRSDRGEHLKDTPAVPLGKHSADHVMDSVSENSTNCCESPTENTRSLRRCRKRVLLDGEGRCCPVCGTCVRQDDLSSHLMVEVEKLNRLSRCGRKVSQDSSTSSHGKKSRVVMCRSDSSSVEETSKSRYEMFQRIQSERQSRMAAQHKKASETRCPVCNKCIVGNASDLNQHVDQCLMNKGDAEEDCIVDIDGEDDDQGYEEYTWAGQTRVRVTTMLEGGLAGSGFKCATKNEDEDGDLNVDGDESEMFGRPQYSEVDLIPCCSDEPAEEKARKALRKAVLRNENGTTLTSRESGSPVVSEVSSQGESIISSATTNTATNNTATNKCQVDATEVIASLKARIQQDVVQLTKSNVPRCLICMEMYTRPLTSIQCWHVHCEDCWLRTLGAKKLCPQCNMITSPSDLRRIYL